MKAAAVRTHAHRRDLPEECALCGGEICARQRHPCEIGSKSGTDRAAAVDVQVWQYAADERGPRELGSCLICEWEGRWVRAVQRLLMSSLGASQQVSSLRALQGIWLG